MEKIEQKLDEILEVLRNLNIRIQRIETSERPISPMETSLVRLTGERKISIKEFLLECKPSGDVQKTLAVAYFLEVHEGMGSFNNSPYAPTQLSVKIPSENS